MFLYVERKIWRYLGFQGPFDLKMLKPLVVLDRDIFLQLGSKANFLALRAYDATKFGKLDWFAEDSEAILVDEVDDELCFLVSFSQARVR
ncbi:hypothetical protein D3C86_1530890 [compost metagenome]